MDLQKGMTFFTGSIRSNRVATDKLVRAFRNPQFQELVKLREEDEDLLEDVIVEHDQAYDIVRVYSDVLGCMMDAAASIISNNLNIVMKFMAAVTIILSIPTLVSGLWGMNVGLPFSEHPKAFLSSPSSPFLPVLQFLSGCGGRGCFDSVKYTGPHKMDHPE